MALGSSCMRFTQPPSDTYINHDFTGIGDKGIERKYVFIRW